MQCEGVAWLRGLEVLQWPVSSPNLGLQTGNGGAGGTRTYDGMAGVADQ